MKNRLRLKEVAAHMNLCEETIRRGLQQGVFPWGDAAKTSSMHTYCIYANKFDDFGRMDVRDAAKLMNVNPQFIRVKLKKRELPFGYAIKSNGERWTYYINPEKFAEYTGVEMVQAS